MAIDKFIPELWSAAVLEPFEETLVYGQPAIANRDYEGQIRQQGDTVHISSIGAPTIKAYAKGTDLATEDLTDSDQTLVIDQGDYFSFYVQDVDRVQAAGDFQSPATREAGQGLAQAFDTFLAKTLAAGVAAANKVGRVTVVNDGGVPGTGQTAAMQAINKIVLAMDKAKIPQAGRYLVVDPQFIAALRATQLANVSAAGSDETLRNGLVTRLYGLSLYVSSNAPKVGGSGADKDDLVLIGGVSQAFSAAEQIIQTEAIRAQARFADIVRGLHVYGSKVTRSTGIVTATASYAAAGPTAP
ncbi:hypothetical protein [Oerskovia turbata]